MPRNNPADRGTQPVTVTRFDEQRAKEAYEAHIALLDQERRIPSLKNNPAWQMLRQDAYEAFALAFGGQA